MSILIVADHDNATLKAATLHAVTAAQKIGGDIHVLVAGAGARPAAEAAAKVAGVAKVLLAEAPALEHQLAEAVAPLVVDLARGYSHVLATATSAGKNLLPRVAALLDVQQISEITAVDAPDTFERPIYAGNAIATVQSADPIKVITVRGTAFEAAAAEGGSAAIESIEAKADAGLSSFVGQELSKSERPELTSARIIISGGRAMGSSENFKILEGIADHLGADERRLAGIADRLHRLDRRRAAACGCGIETRRPHGDHLERVETLHRGDRVARVDRPLERVGRDHLGDVGDLADVELGGDTR